MCPPHICFFLVQSFDVETSKQQAALLSAISAFLKTQQKSHFIANKFDQGNKNYRTVMTANKATYLILFAKKFSMIYEFINYWHNSNPVKNFKLNNCVEDLLSKIEHQLSWCLFSHKTIIKYRASFSLVNKKNQFYHDTTEIISTQNFSTCTNPMVIGHYKL